MKKTRLLYYLSAVALILALFSPAYAARQNIKPIDMSKFFGGHKNSAFVLYNRSTGVYYVYGQELARKRFSPCSTFKIPNSLIGLETGVIKDENHVIEWDGKEGRLKSWNRDHSLATAIKNSVVWYYKALAGMVGEKRMKSFVEKCGYGNMDISGGLDSFWLHGPSGTLKISAFEQVEFLNKFLDGALPFSKRNIGIVKKMIELQAGSGYTLSGKTGSGTENGRHVCGWFVGFAATRKADYVFAALINADYEFEDSPALGSEAKRITLTILKSMGIIK